MASETSIPLTRKTRDRLRAEMIQAQARLGKELSYDDMINVMLDAIERNG